MLDETEEQRKYVEEWKQELREFCADFSEAETRAYLGALIGDAIKAFYPDRDFVTLALKVNPFDVDDGREGVEVTKTTIFTNIEKLNKKEHIMQLLQTIVERERNH